MTKGLSEAEKEEKAQQDYLFDIVNGRKKTKMSILNKKNVTPYEMDMLFNDWE